MTLFFILLIALVVYQFSTRKSLLQTYPQFNKVQIRRLSNVPFNFATWALFLLLCVNMLSALTSAIGELFNVDNYISLFSGGWIGIALRFLRSNGFIGDIQEPSVLLQYRETISLIYSVTFFSCIICAATLIGFCRELKKTRFNGTAILTYYYISIACGLASFLVFMWGLYEFNQLLNHAVIFHMEEIFIFLSIIFVVGGGASIYWGNRSLKELFSLPQCEMITWQQFLAKVKINTDKGKKQITESQIVYITIGVALLISGYVILSTLLIDKEAEVAEYEEISEDDIVIAPAEEQNTYNTDEKDCITTLQQYYTSSYSQIEALGGKETFETERFIKYTSCWGAVVLTSTQDFGIGDDCLVLKSIKPNYNISNSFIVYVSCGYSDEIPTCVVMKKEGEKWKIDNIAYEPYTAAYIDYSRPVSDYNFVGECGDAEEDFNDDMILDETPEESENFISL